MAHGRSREFVENFITIEFRALEISRTRLVAMGQIVCDDLGRRASTDESRDQRKA
jgi:hypothetical protein